MIRAVTVINTSSLNKDAITMKLDGLRNGPFTLWKIDGIGPGKADINITEAASTDGGSFNSARQNSREITLTLVLNWYDGSIEAARHYSYQFFPLKKKVRLIIYSTENLKQSPNIVKNPTSARYIDGYVMQNEPEIFSSLCAVEVVLKCPDPYFYACSPNLIDSPSINPESIEEYKTYTMGSEISSFYFPFSNLENSLNFGGSIPNDIIDIPYPLYASETGCYFIFKISRSLEDSYPKIIIQNTRTNSEFKLDFSFLRNYADFSNGLQIGDKIIISSIPGSKDVVILRGGYYTSIIGVIEYDSIWPVLYPGENLYRCYSQDNLYEIGIEVSARYKEKYGGV